MPTRAQEVAGHLLHQRVVHAVEKARALERLAAEEQVARDRQLGDERRILVDRLDAERDRVASSLRMSTFLPRTMMSPLVAGAAPESTLISVDLPAPLSPSSPTISRCRDREGDVVERLHAAVELVDVLHADEIVGHRRQVPAWCRRSSQECSAIMPRMIAPMKML